MQYPGYTKHSAESYLAPSLWQRIQNQIGALPSALAPSKAEIQGRPVMHVPPQDSPSSKTKVPKMALHLAIPSLSKEDSASSSISPRTASPRTPLAEIQPPTPVRRVTIRQPAPLPLQASPFLTLLASQYQSEGEENEKTPIRPPKPKKVLAKLRVDATYQEASRYLGCWAAQGQDPERNEIKNRLLQCLNQNSGRKLFLNSLPLCLLPDIFHTALFAHHLTDLNLQNSKITELPESLIHLKCLDTLDLSRNPKLTSLPSWIGNFVYMRKLLLNSTGIQRLPQEFTQLEHLTHLNLNKTPLSEVPAWIGQLHKLKYLFLKRIQATVLPQELNNLRQLVFLDLQKNPQITVLPPISNLSSLKGLYLDGTRISALPEGIERLMALKFLDFTETLISQTVCLRIRQLEKLRILPSVNQIDYMISSSTQLTDAYRVSYFVREERYVIDIRIDRTTCVENADEHLHLLGIALRAVHRTPTANWPPKLSVIVNYLYEEGLDPTENARGFLSQILPCLIAQDAKQGNRLFLKEADKYTLSCIHTIKKMQICRAIGTLINAVGTGLLSEGSCQIGKIFSSSFYTHLALIASTPSTSTTLKEEDLNPQFFLQLRMSYLRGLSARMAEEDDLKAERNSYETYSNRIAPLQAVAFETKKLFEIASAQVRTGSHQESLSPRTLGRQLARLVQGE